MQQPRITRMPLRVVRITRGSTFALFFFLSLAIPAFAQGLRVLSVRSEAEASDLRARIQAGESFDEIARKYSTDPSAGAGGYLGKVALRDLRKEFQDALQGLEPDEVSRVIKIGEDFFLLRRITDREVRWQAHMDKARDALQQAKFPQAEQSIRDAVQEAEGFGSEDLRLVASIRALARLHWAQSDYESAASLYERIISIQEKRLNPEHADVSVSLGNLAAIYREKRDYSRAIPFYERAIAIQEKKEDPLQLAELVRQLAELFEEQENPTRAEPLYRRALAVYKSALPADDPRIKQTEDALRELLKR
jgi:tetratricopeptide (TPR) repeat protein